jgi:peptidoglycan hydrolase-like protein with peptidoglycan-binding domain
MNKLVAVVLVAAVAIMGTVALVALLSSDDADPEPVAEVASEAETAAVVRRDITETRTVEGTLGFGEKTPFPTGGTGVVTSLPAKGARIDPGIVLYGLDNHPVHMFPGEVPMYRDFEIEMEDGADVLQLEQTLDFLGYGTGMTVDANFTTATADAIEDWQTNIGVPATGLIEKGKIVFYTDPIRIASVDSTVGAQIIPDQVIFQISDINQVVTVELPPEDRDLFAPEDQVEVEFPDGLIIPGTVTAVRETTTSAAAAAPAVPGAPQADEGSDTIIEVTIVLAEDPGASGFEGVPVEIEVVTSQLSGVLVVPVPSLLALAGGGHAVEVVVETPEGTKTTELIGVELGEFADGMVEITGEIAEGDVVVVVP